MGGSDNDEVTSLYVTDSGVYVAGSTYSDDFPINGGVITSCQGEDGFVSRLSLDLGHIDASTYLGGNDWDQATSLYVTDSGVYVAGETYSDDFPGRNIGAITSNNGDEDGFVSKLSLDLGHIDASTYLGGKDWDEASSLYVRGTSVYVAGRTESDDFPIYGGAITDFQGGEEGFVSKLSLDLGHIDASTYLGGSDWDWSNTIYVSSTGVFVAGWTKSDDFPSYGGTITDFQGGYRDGFVSKLSLNLESIDISTYLGGGGDDDAISLYVSSTGLYVAGWTSSSDFPVNNGYDTTEGGCRDGFITFFSSDYFGGTGGGGSNNHSPVINSFYASSSFGTVPLTVTLTANASDPDGDSLTYYYDCEGDGTYEESSSINTHQCTYNTAGTYHPKVKVEDPSGANDEDETTVTVSSTSGNNPPIISSFTSNPSSGFAPLMVTFTVTVSDPDGDNLTHKWDFDGDDAWDKTGSSDSESYTYSKPGTFTVKVEVDDSKGASDTATVTVEVKTATDKNSGNKNENKTDNATGANASAKVDKSTGCGCSVGNNSNKLGDLLIFLLPMLLWMWQRKKLL